MTRKEKIIEILDLWSMGITETRNAVADEILALPIEVPGDEEFEAALEKESFRVPYDGSSDFYDETTIKHWRKCWAWMRDEIIKRNRP